MAKETILITGASSGLGLAFLQHYACIASSPQIIAVDAIPFPAKKSSIMSKPNVSFYRVDITSSDLPSQLVWAQLTPMPISLVIHCAGVRGLVHSAVQQKRGDMAAAETWDVMDHATMLRAFEVNTWGSFNLITTILSNLRLAKKPKVVIFSSRMGSVTANTVGGGYAYRASKAALNAVVKSFSVDVPDVNFLLLHPGRVETGLVEWKEEGAISAEESVKDCLKVIEGLDEERSGTLVDRFGNTIEW